MKFISIPIMILLVGGGITGYGYWLGNSADKILSTEIPAQERLLAQYKSDVDSLERQVAYAYKKYQEVQKKIDENWDKMIIELAAAAIIPSPISLLRIKEIGLAFDLLESMIETIKLSGKIDKVGSAFSDFKTLQEYLMKYQTFQKELDKKKKLIQETEERIRQLKIIVTIKSKRALLVKNIGGVTLGGGVLGTLIVVFLI